MNTSTTGTRGFTIIEMSVVLVLFMLVIGTVVTIFISMVQHQKRALQDQQFLDQASYASESLSRELRTSIKDTEGACVGAGNIYLLTHYNQTSGFYEGVTFLTNDGICHQVYTDENGALEEVKSSAAPVPILSAQLVVENIRFIINGDKTIATAQQGDQVQPRVTFLLHLKSHGASADQQDKIIETTVSQRNLNIP